MSSDLYDKDREDIPVVSHPYGGKEGNQMMKRITRHINGIISLDLDNSSELIQAKRKILYRNVKRPTLSNMKQDELQEEFNSEIIGKYTKRKNTFHDSKSISKNPQNLKINSSRQNFNNQAVILS